MSGHNKWSKIKHKKAVSDVKKSKIFAKLVKLIAVESRLAGGDVNAPGLRTAIEQAKKENMPKDNIERAIKKGIGKNSENLEAITYEAYGPGGIAMIMEVLTDNRNRTSAEIKHVLSKNNILLSRPGSALWAFEKEGSTWKAKSKIKIKESEKTSLKNLVDELGENEDVQEVFSNEE